MKKRKFAAVRPYEQQDIKTFISQGRKVGGFTLIELLIVVLIIGILAAIALPQYQKAVFKTRLAQAITYVKVVHDAQEMYYLANGTYATTMEQLDIKMACPPQWKCLFQGGEGGGYGEAIPVKYPNMGIIYSSERRQDMESLSGKLYCYAQPYAAFENNICKSFGPKLPAVRNATNRYEIKP